MSRFSVADFPYYLSRLLRKLQPKAVFRSQLHPTARVQAGSQFFSSSMDRHSYCGYDCQITYAQIGAFVSIANNVIIGGGRHPMEWASMSPVFYRGRDSLKTKFSEHDRAPPKRVIVGCDVWIGHSAIVLPGVTIGHGAVVGAGAVVTKPVPPFAIVAGNPARLIRYRFPEDVCTRLLNSEWWLLADAELKKQASLVNQVEHFLSALERDKS